MDSQYSYRFGLSTTYYIGKMSYRSANDSVLTSGARKPPKNGEKGGKGGDNELYKLVAQKHFFSIYGGLPMKIHGSGLFLARNTMVKSTQSISIGIMAKLTPKSGFLWITRSSFKKNSMQRHRWNRTMLAHRYSSCPGRDKVFYDIFMPKRIILYKFQVKPQIMGVWVNCILLKIFLKFWWVFHIYKNI